MTMSSKVKATVLVIDDEEEICRGIEAIFKEDAPEFTVLTADNGRDGIELAKKHRPDVILLDLFLYDGLEGVEALRQIKQFHPQGKVAIFTGYDRDIPGSRDHDIFDQVDAIGVDAYMVKPVMPPDLIKMVQELFQKKKSEEKNG